MTKLNKKELEEKLETIRKEKEIGKTITKQEYDKSVREIEISLVNQGSKLADTWKVYVGTMNLMVEEFCTIRDMYNAITDEDYLDKQEALVLKQLKNLH